MLLPLLSLLFINNFPFKMLWHTMILTTLLLTFLLIFTLYSPMLDSSYLSPLFDYTPLSASLFMLSFILLPLMMIASYKILHTKAAPALFVFTIMMLTTVLVLAFSFSNALAFYIVFELSLIPTAFLIMFWGYQPERINATIYLILYTVSFSFPLLIMMLHHYFYLATMSFPLLLCSYPHIFYYPTLTTLSFIAAFLAKLPMFLMHLWLPKAHVEAPIAGSMILAGVLLKLGIYGLLKFMPMTPIFSTWLPSLLISLSMLGMIITSIICLQQTDIKSLIAYSSVSHMGLVLAALLTGHSLAWNGALFMAIAHGLASSALFMLANYTYNYTQSRNLFLMKGFLTTSPKLSFWWFMFLILNLAAPPSLNFMSEIILISSLLTHSYYLAPLLSLAIILSAAYSLLLYASAQHGQMSTFTLPHFPSPLSSLVVLMLHLLPLLFLVLTPNLLFWN